MSAPSLPSLPKSGILYVLVLLVLAVGFYLLLLACIAAVGYALYWMALWVPDILRRVHNVGALKLIAVAFLAVAAFGIAIAKGFLVRVGGDPVGVKATRSEFPKLFQVIDEVAGKVGAKPISEVFLTPGDEVGVWEEAALYLPPGFGKRKIVLGMGALNYLTLDQLRAILAHEYGHFSNRDTFFSRFIYRVSNSYHLIVEELADDKLHYINPLFWALRIYTWIYELIASSFSRVREFHADRFAVEAYGRDLFCNALVTAHLEGTFFGEVGMRQVYELASQRQRLTNMYHSVGLARRDFDRQNPGHARKILGQIMSSRTGAFDSHPSLGERLKAQGMPTALVQVPPTPRVLVDPAANHVPQTIEHAEAHQGPASAAEELFGQNSIRLQQRLTDLVSMHASQVIDLMRRAREAALES